MELRTKYLSDASILLILFLFLPININIDRLCSSKHKYKAKKFEAETISEDANATDKIRISLEDISLLEVELINIKPNIKHKTLKKISHPEFSSCEKSKKSIATNRSNTKLLLII